MAAMGAERTTSAGARPAAARPDVFVSYARQDKPFVEGRLWPALVRRDKDVWIDLEDIPPAADWLDRVLAGVESANAFVFVISPASAASRICLQELARAVEHNKRLVPVLRRDLEGVTPPAALERPNWILMREEDDFGAGLALLIEALETDLEWRDLHTRLTVRTTEWLVNDRDPGFLLHGSDLHNAERWLAAQGGHGEAATADQTAYILAGRREATRRQRLTLAAAGIAVVVAVSLAIFALIQSLEAIDQRDEARTQQRLSVSRELAATSISRLDDNAELGTLLAVEANEISETGQALAALRQALERWGGRAALPAAGRVDALAFSPDGRRIVRGTSRGGAVHAADDGHRLFDLGSRPVTHAAFDARGEHVLSIDEWGAQLTHAISGRRLARLEGDVVAAVFAGGRRPLAARRTPADRLEVRDVATGRVVAALGEAHELGAEGAALSPDGRSAVSWSYDEARVWDLERARPVGARLRSGSSFHSAAFSPDGRRVAFTDLSNRVRVRDVRRNGDLGTVRGAIAVDMVRFSPDGRRLAVGTFRNALLWDVARRRVVRRLPLSGSATAMEFVPRGDVLVTADRSSRISTWRLAGGRLLQRTAARDAVRALTINRSADTIAFGTQGGRTLLTSGASGLTGARLRRARYGTFSRDGRYIVTGASGGARVWSIRGRRLTALRAGGSPIIVVGFSDDARRVLTVDEAGEVAIWDRAGGRLLGAHAGGRGVVVADSSPKGDAVVIGRKDGSLFVWRVATGAVRRLPRHAKEIALAEWTGDGRYLVTAATGEPPRVQRPSGERVRVLGRDDEFFAATLVSADGRRVVSAEVDRFRAWDTRTGTRVDLPAPESGWTGWLRLDESGRRILVPYRNETSIWDLDDPSLERITVAGSGAANLSGDGRYLAMIERDGGVRMWDSETGSAVMRLPGRVSRSALLEVSRDGRRVLVMPPGEDMRLLSCDLCQGREALVALARRRLPRELTPAERRKYVPGLA